jgi:hypothetical protein
MPEGRTASASMHLREGYATPLASDVEACYSRAPLRRGRRAPSEGLCHLPRSSHQHRSDFSNCGSEALKAPW